MDSYWGSVRFFKHMILLLIALLILTPTALAVHFGMQSHQLKNKISQMKAVRVDVTDPVDPDSSGATLSATSPGSTDEPAVSQPTDAELAYQTLYPDLYAESATQSKTSGVAYLTFDDGPSNLTGKVLDILKQNNAKATFFVVGKALESDEGKACLKRIADEGHTIGIHTYTHDYTSIYNSIEDYLADFYQTYQAIYEITGVKVSIFRFPGGSINSYNAPLYQELIAEMTRRGFSFYDWNVSSGDAASSKGTSAADIVANVTKQSANYGRVIILFHDASTKGTTVEALPSVISQLSAKGFTFDRLTNEVKPITFSYKDKQ